MNGGEAEARREHWAEALLRERAEHLARRPEADAAPVVTRLVCSADGALYGLALTQLTRVLDYERPAPAPSANRTLLGVIGRSGGFYLIFDLARLIAPSSQGMEGGRIVLLRRATPMAGLRVDDALGVVDLAPLAESELSGVAPQHAAISGFARHPDGRLVSLLDLNQMLPANRAASQGGS